MFEIDEYGNKLFTINDGAYLKLSSNNHPIKILDISEDGRFSKYVKRKNIFKKTNSIGFNYNLLVGMAKALSNPVIHLTIEDMGEYEVYVKDILEEKQFLNYKDNGFELQCFFPIEKMKLINKYKEVIIPNIGDKIYLDGQGGIVEAVSSSGKTLYVKFGKQIAVVRTSDIDRVQND